MALSDYTDSKSVSEYSRYIATEYGFYNMGWGIAAPDFNSPSPCGGSRRYPTETDEQWCHKLQLDMTDFNRKVYYALHFEKD